MPTYDFFEDPVETGSRPPVDRHEPKDPATRVTGKKKTRPDPGLVLDPAFRQDIEGLLGIVMRGHHIGPENARSMKAKKQPGYYTLKGMVAETCLRVKKRLEGSP